MAVVAITAEANAASRLNPMAAAEKGDKLPGKNGRGRATENGSE